MEKEIEYTEFDSFYVVAGTKYDGAKAFFIESGYEYGEPSQECGYCTSDEANIALKDVRQKVSEQYVSDLRVEKATMYWSSEPIN